MQRTVGGVLTDATTVTLADSTNTFGIKNNASGATVVAAGTATTHPSTGVYEYNVDALAVGSYTIVWKVVDGAVTSYVVQVFSIDATQLATDGPTLADVERELAYRVGPYRQETVTSGTTSAMVINALKSTISSFQGIEDQYILRRGKLADGSAIVGFNSDDRIRMVDSVDVGTGSVTPDRVWAVAPAANEQVEFHYLHPQQELRKSVLEGLKRCYFYDRGTIAFTGAASERNLTASLSWLTRRKQVKRIQSQYTGSLFLPADVEWWEPFEVAGSVYLHDARDPYPSTMLVYALRPGHTLVNGATSIAGPNDDEDILAVDVDYAASSAHVEAWRRFRPRLLPAAAQGMQISQVDAARYFTQVSRKHNPPKPQRWGLSAPLGYTGPELP